MPTLATKLQIKSGQSLLILNSPKGLLSGLKSELDGIKIVNSRKPDNVLIFVYDLEEVRHGCFLKSNARTKYIILDSLPKRQSGN